MLDNLKQYNIILASNSPRRKELLAGLDIPFEVKIIPGIDENCPVYLKGSEIPRYLSRKKAEAYIGQMSDHDLIITAIRWYGSMIRLYWVSRPMRQRLVVCLDCCRVKRTM